MSASNYASKFMIRAVIVAATVGFALVAQSQTQPAQPQRPATQPPYPSSPPQRRINQAQPSSATDDAARGRRCDALKGLEKSECERRDTVDDDAPAGMTPAMREKEEKARAEREAASTTSAADPESDTAGTRKPRTAAASDTEAEKELRNESRPTQPATRSDTESDSLERPRGQ